MPNAYILCDTQTHVLEWNRAEEKIFGYSKEEMIGKDLVRFIVPEKVRYRVRGVINKLKVGEVAYFSEKDNIIPKDGKLISCQWYNTPLTNENGDVFGILCMAQDITKRRQVEDALKRSREKLKIIFESALDTIYLTDLEGIFLDGNKTAENIMRYKKEELIRKSILNLKILSAKELHKASKLLMKNVQGKGTGPDEFLLNRKDCSKVPVEISTYPIKIKNKNVVLGIARDITERKQAEEKLKSRNKELETWAEVTTDRELFMLKLKKEINELLEKSGKNRNIKLRHNVNTFRIPFFQRILEF